MPVPLPGDVHELGVTSAPVVESDTSKAREATRA